MLQICQAYNKVKRKSLKVTYEALLEYGIPFLALQALDSNGESYGLVPMEDIDFQGTALINIAPDFIEYINFEEGGVALKSVGAKGRDILVPYELIGALLCFEETKMIMSFPYYCADLPAPEVREAPPKRTPILSIVKEELR